MVFPSTHHGFFIIMYLSVLSEWFMTMLCNILNVHQIGRSSHRVIFVYNSKFDINFLLPWEFPIQINNDISRLWNFFLHLFL